MKDKKILELVSKVQNADRDAFSELYDYYFKRIFGYVFRRTANIIDSEDITANIFVKVLKKIRSFKGQNKKGGEFHCWMFRIASNEVNDYFRKGKKSAPLEDDKIQHKIEFGRLSDDLEKIQNEMDQNIEYSLLHQALLRLKPLNQDLIVMRYFEDMKFVDIAKNVNKKEKSIRMYFHRALNELRDVLREKNTKKIETLRPFQGGSTLKGIISNN
jgi:RNA polymerase sigma-70 factor (ECF subfamily)